MQTITVTSSTKPERYEEVLPQIRYLIQDETDVTAILANTSAALKQSFDYYSWVGFYRYRKSTDGLVLGPFQGKVACVHIKMGTGVCGTAASERRTIIVPDVNKFPGHISCDPESRSEIVVPLVRYDNLFGVLDIDSYYFNAFDQIDRIYLEKLAEHISVRL